MTVRGETFVQDFETGRDSLSPTYMRLQNLSQELGEKSQQVSEKFSNLSSGAGDLSNRMGAALQIFSSFRLAAAGLGFALADLALTEIAEGIENLGVRARETTVDFEGLADGTKTIAEEIDNAQDRIRRLNLSMLENQEIVESSLDGFDAFTDSVDRQRLRVEQANIAWLEFQQRIEDTRRLLQEQREEEEAFERAGVTRGAGTGRFAEISRQAFGGEETPNFARVRDLAERRREEERRRRQRGRGRGRERDPQEEARLNAAELIQQRKELEEEAQAEEEERLRAHNERVIALIQERKDIESEVLAERMENAREHARVERETREQEIQNILTLSRTAITGLGGMLSIFGDFKRAQFILQGVDETLAGTQALIVGPNFNPIAAAQHFALAGQYAAAAADAGGVSFNRGSVRAPSGGGGAGGGRSAGSVPSPPRVPRQRPSDPDEGRGVSGMTVVVQLADRRVGTAVVDLANAEGRRNSGRVFNPNLLPGR